MYIMIKFYHIIHKKSSVLFKSLTVQLKGDKSVH